MRVIVNGTEREIDDAATVADVVSTLGFGPRHVVVERNGEPVERSAMGSTPVGPGDVLEIVRPVQGGAGARGALADARLYLVADDRLTPALLDELLDAGVDIFQLRMKGAEAADVVRAATPLVDVCRSRGMPFVVNDRPDVALAVGADGVHLGQDDLSPVVARRILGPDAIIGRSTHSVEQIEAVAREAIDGLADYAAVGPVHATPTKPGRPPVGPGLVAEASGRLDVPWFAIGGIDTSNVAEVVAAGASRVVVVRAIVDAADPVAAAKTLIEALR